MCSSTAIDEDTLDTKETTMNRRRLAGLLLTGMIAIPIGLVNAGPAQASPVKPAAGTVEPVGIGAAVVIQDGGFVHIVNDHADKCAEVDGNGRQNAGTLIHEWSCDGEGNQLWAPADLGNGFFQLHNGGSGFCMNVRSDLRVDQQPCNASLSGQWWQLRTADGFGHLWLASGIAGLCLALSPNTSRNGTPVVVGDCSLTSAKFWHFE
jgi:hypothetical protein